MSPTPVTSLWKFDSWQWSLGYTDACSIWYTTVKQKAIILKNTLKSIFK